MPYYTGVGSRRTPPAILDRMEEIATSMRARGWRLRSGAADGADQAFGRGALDHADIYVPWRGFGRTERGARLVELAPDWRLYDEHVRLHRLGCPHHERLSQGAERLHARNVLQVVGDTPGTGSSDPSKFLVCWTPGGNLEGGTATAIRIATHLKVPVFNLGYPDALQRLAAHVSALTALSNGRPRPAAPGLGKIRVISVASLGGTDKLDPNIDHYVGRSREGLVTHLGNQWTHHRSGHTATHVVQSREAAIAAFKRWLWGDNIRPFIETGAKTPAMQELIDLARHVKQGKDVNLACWCKPAACHGDVIAAAIRYLIAEHSEAIS